MLSPFSSADVLIFLLSYLVIRNKVWHTVICLYNRSETSPREIKTFFKDTEDAKIKNIETNFKMQNAFTNKWLLSKPILINKTNLVS